MNEISQAIHNLPQFIQLANAVEDVTKDNEIPDELAKEEQELLLNSLNQLLLAIDQETENDSIPGLNTISFTINLLLKQVKSTKNLKQKSNILNKNEENENSNLIEKLKEGLALPENTDESNILDYLTSLIDDKNDFSEIHLKLQEALRTIALKDEFKDERNNEIVELKQKIAKLSGSPIYTSQNDFYLEGNEDERTRTEVIEDEETEKMIAKIQKQKAKIEKLENAIEDISSEKDDLEARMRALEEENEKLKLKMQYQSTLSNDSDKSPSKMDINEIQTQYEEEKLQTQKILEDTMNDYMQALEDAATIQEKYMPLTDLIQRSIELHKTTELQLQKALQERDDLKGKNKLLQDQLQSTKQNTQNNGTATGILSFAVNDDLSSIRALSFQNGANANKVLDILFEISQNISEENGLNVQTLIEDDKLDLEGKVTETLEILEEETREKKQEKELENQKEMNVILRRAVNNEFSFIQKLCNSKDTVEWLNEDISPSELRQMLSLETKKISNFISNNALGLVEDSYVLDYAGLNSINIDETNEKIEEVMTKYIESKSAEVQEIFLTLAEVIVANDVLRRFGQEAQQQCKKFNQIVKTCKQELETEKEKLQQEKDEEQRKLKEALQKEMKKRLKLEYLIRGENRDINPEDIDQSIDQSMEEDDYLNDPDIKQLMDNQKKINSLENQLSQKNQEMEKYKQDTEKTLLNLNEMVDKITNEKKEKEEQYNKRISELNKQMEELETKLNKLSSDYANNLDKTSELTVENHDLVEQIKKHEDLLAQTQRQAKQQYEFTVQQLQEEIQSLQESYEQGKIIAATDIANMRKQFKKKYEELQQNLEATTQKSNAKDSLLNDFKNQIDDLNQQMAESKEQLNKSIKQLQNENKTLSIEKKILETKLQTKGKATDREKAMIESNWKMQLMSQKTKSDTAMEALRQELSLQMKNFMQRITNIFPDFIADYSKQTDQDSIISMLEEIKKQLTSQKTVNFTASKAVEQIDEIKSFLNAPKNANALQLVKELSAKLTSQEEKINTLTEKQKQLPNTRIASKAQQKNRLDDNNIQKRSTSTTEWDEWAQRIGEITTGRVCTMLTSNELRNLVEDSLIENTSTSIRKCNTLREEKKVLLAVLNSVSSTVMRTNRKCLYTSYFPSSSTISLKMKKCSLRHLILIGMTIRRVQRLTGHNVLGMKLEKLDEEDARIDNTKKEQKTQPLFSNFIISDDSDESDNLF